MCFFLTGGDRKPPIRIIRIETLQNDKSFTKIREELSSHIVFGRRGSSDSRKVVVKKQKISMKPTTSVVGLSKTEPRKGNAKQLITVSVGKTPVSQERMKRFLSMTQEDLPQQTKKVYACEKDIKYLTKPKDTIRCDFCSALYEPINKKEHIKNCPKSNTQRRKYACATCAFQHVDIKEIEKHVELVHKK